MRKRLLGTLSWEQRDSKVRYSRSYVFGCIFKATLSSFRVCVKVAATALCGRRVPKDYEKECMCLLLREVPTSHNITKMEYRHQKVFTMSQFLSKFNEFMLMRFSSNIYTGRMERTPWPGQPSTLLDGPICSSSPCTRTYHPSSHTHNSHPSGS